MSLLPPPQCKYEKIATDKYHHQDSRAIVNQDCKEIRHDDKFYKSIFKYICKFIINCNCIRHTLKFLRNKYLYIFFNRIKISSSSKILKSSDLYLKNSQIIISGKNNRIFIGKNVKIIGMRVFMNGSNNKIYIGDNVIINASKYQPTILNAIGGKSITLGNGCLLSNNIEIHTSDYHGIYSLSDGKRLNDDKNIYIGEHTWIGLGATLLKGTQIGRECIIGAKSVVSGTFNNPHSIIAGNPGKVISREDVTWTLERKSNNNI